MPDLEHIKDLLEAASYIITILGLPLAIFVFLEEKKKARREREYGTYDALDEKYVDFLRLSLEYDQLNIYYDEDKAARLTEGQRRQQLIVFEILISILERAYLMYRDQSSRIKQEQWQGWNQYMTGWLQNQSFRIAWLELCEQWEINFTNHMHRLYDETKPVEIKSK